jgi:ribose transport system substrate-binding protein
VLVGAEVLQPDDTALLQKFLKDEYLSDMELDAAPEVKFDPTGKKIGYIYLTLAHPYYQAHQAHTREYAKQLGFELVEYDGKADAAVMTNAMEDLIEQKVDGIVFALLDPAAAVPSINEAQKAGIPVVTFAIKHGDEAKAPFVGIPEGKATEQAGKLAAARFVKQFGADAQANVATVECPSIQAIVDRADGFIKGFTEALPEAKVVARADGNCVRDQALSATEDLLQAHPEVNVIYGGNGDSSLGALAALQGAGRGKAGDVLLVSHDGTEPEIKELVNPDSGLKLSVANRPRELAQATIDTLFEILAGTRDVTSTDEVLVGAEVLQPDDTALLQKFLKDEYLSDMELK